MGQIFLSYAREDRGYAECLVRALEGAGHSVWWDRHIDSGEEFSAQIEAELDKANVVLVAWSKQSVTSRWVRDEAAVGGDTGRLVPVTVDGSLPPLGFRQFQTQDLSGWKGSRRDARTAQLLRSIDRRLTVGGKEASPLTPPQRRRGFRLYRLKQPLVIAATLVLVLVIVGGISLLNSRNRAAGPLPKPTIALLPLIAPSADAELRDIAAQTRDSMSHTLPQSGIAVRLLTAPPPDGRSASDYLISGDVSRNGDRIIATVRLDEAGDGVTVFSRRFEAGHDEVRDLPERIGAQMADFFDGATLLVLDPRRRLEPTVMAELLADSDDQLQNYQSSKRVAANAPDDPNAQIRVAFFTGLALRDLSRGERPQAVIAGRQAAERALALAPGFGDTYATWCLLHSETRLAECESKLRTGSRVDPDASYLNGFLAALMRTVGRFEEAADLSRLSYTHNPFNQFKIAEMLHTFELAGNSDGARSLYELGARWWPQSKFRFFADRLSGLVERGDFNAMQRVEDQVGAATLPPNFQKTAALAVALKSKSASALRRICADPQEFLLDIRCMIAFATIGDEDRAYSIAAKLYPRRVGRTAVETERIWLDDPDKPLIEFITSPAAAPMRRDPRYMALAQRTGLLDYWRTGGLPDFCRRQPEPICRQLRGRS